MNHEQLIQLNRDITIYDKKIEKLERMKKFAEAWIVELENRTERIRIKNELEDIDLDVLEIMAHNVEKYAIKTPTSLDRLLDIQLEIMKRKGMKND